MALLVDQFMCRSDNFGILLHDEESGVTALIDAPEEETIIAAVERTGWKPDLLLITHHHGDHVAANLALKELYGVKIYGPVKEQDRIPGIDQAYQEGDVVMIGQYQVHVVETPGHTMGHVSLHIPTAGLGFTADTLFSLGCGRLFECGPETMFASLQKISTWPPETKIYCGHEYTLSNADFALTIDPDNQALQARAKQVRELRAQGLATLPTSIGAELATNPFLRASDRAIRANLKMEDAPAVDVFAEIRKRKDHA